MSEIKETPIWKFCNQVELSPLFVGRLMDLFNKLGNGTGLTPEEWAEYREKARMFTDQVLGWLRKQPFHKTPTDTIDFHRKMLLEYLEYQSHISYSSKVTDEDKVKDYLREKYIP
jgi:hypothetical protein